MEKTMKVTGKMKLVALAVGVALLFVATRLLPVAETLTRLQEWVASLGPAGPLAYGVIYVVGALLFIPGSLLTIGAGLLFGLVGGTILVSIASTLAAALAFLIARHLARAQVESWSARHERFAAISKVVEERGAAVVFYLRLSPLVPFNLSNYLYGLTPVKFWPYVFASWAGMLPATVLYVYLGTTGRAATEGRSVAEWTLFGAGLLATLVVGGMVGAAARKELDRSRLG
jgi:uncharacterized membrane protein YdjX (TVP38/TMEM64 family)